MMLDEPSLGLSPRLTNEVFAQIARAQPLARPCHPPGRAEYSQRALELANRAYVLELGRKVMEGLPSESARRPSLRDAYLAGRATEPRNK